MFYRQDETLPENLYEIREIVKELFEFHSSGQFIDLAQMKCQHSLVEKLGKLKSMPRIIKNFLTPLLSVLLLFSVIEVNAQSNKLEKNLKQLFMSRDFETCYENGKKNSLKVTNKSRAFVINCRARLNSEKAEALKAAENFVKETGEDPWALYALANAQISNSKNEEALSSIEKALSKSYDNEDFIFAKTEILIKLKRYADAENFLKASELEIKDKSRRLSLEGVSLYLRGASDSKDAQQIKQTGLTKIQESVKISPQSTAANYLYGTYLNYEKRYAESFPFLKKAIMLSPNVLEIHRELWFSIENNPNKTEAQKNAEILSDINFLAKLRTVSPNTLQAATFQLGKMKLAEKQQFYEDILVKRFPQSKEAEYLDFIKILKFGDKNKDKKPEFINMLWAFVRKPNHIDKRNLMSAYSILLVAAKEDKSTTDNRFLEIVEGRIKYNEGDPSYAYIYNSESLIERKMYADAERILKSSFNVIKIYVESQKTLTTPEEKQSAFDKMSAAAHSALGLVYLNTGRTAEARSELIKAAELDNNDAQIFNRLGQAYEKEGDIDKAEENYINGFLSPWGSVNPNIESIKTLYKKRHGSIEDFDSYFEKYRAEETKLRKQRIIAERIKTPQNAAPFSFKTISDKTVSLDDLKGKIIVINVWGTWCAPCVAEMPQLQQLYKKYESDQDVAIITMDTNDELETVRKFISDKKYTFPVLIGDSYVDNIMLNGNIAFPTTLFIDRQGKVAFMKAGGSDNLFEEFGWRIEALKNDK